LVVGNGTASETITLYTANNTNGNIHFADGTSGQDRYRGYISYMHTDNSMSFGTNDVEALRIDGSGRVAIGTTSIADSATALVIKNSASGNDHTLLDIVCDTNETARVRFSEDGSNFPGEIKYDTNNHFLAFSTNSAERMRIESDGTTAVYGNGNAIVAASNQAAGGTFKLFSGKHSASSTTTGTESIAIYTDGSAIFKGVVIANTSQEAVSDYAGSFTNNRNGSKWQASVVGRNTALNGPVWAGLANNFAATNAGVTSQIFENGNAEFLGSVSIGGRDAAHTIDEYEEGTWTPGLTFGGNSAGIGFSENTGFYNKVGNMVNVWGVMSMTTKGSLTGQALLTNLPFPVRNNSSERGAGLFTYLDNFNNLNSLVRLYTVSNTSVIYLYQADNTPGSIDGTVDLTHSQFEGNSVWRFWFTYRTN
jgi:hypothetical protein